MSSLNLDLNFWRHPKTVKLIAAVGEAGVCALLRLWAYCANFHAESGKLWGYSPADIEGAAEWQGEAGVLVAALLRSDFLDKRAKGYQIHDWLDHEGHIGLYRHRARIASRARWGKTPARRKAPQPQALIPDASSNAKKETSNASPLHCNALNCSSTGGGSKGGVQFTAGADRREQGMVKIAQNIIQTIYRHLGVELGSTPAQEDVVKGMLLDFTEADCLAVVEYFARKCRDNAREREKFSVTFLFSPKVFPGLLALAKRKGLHKKREIPNSQPVPTEPRTPEQLAADEKIRKQAREAIRKLGETAGAEHAAATAQEEKDRQDRKDRFWRNKK